MGEWQMVRKLPLSTASSNASEKKPGSSMLVIVEPSLL